MTEAGPTKEAKEKEMEAQAQTQGFRFSNFKRDEKKSTEGVWVDFAPGNPLKLLIARMNNQKFKAMVRRLMKPYSRQIRTDTLSDSAYEDIQMRAVAHAVLLGWKGLADDDGNLIPYSAVKALELFKDAPAFYDEVVLIAQEAEHFQLAHEEDSEKN